jgi:hypothetical protein
MYWSPDDCHFDWFAVDHRVHIRRTQDGRRNTD